MDSLHNCFIKLIVSIILFRSHSKWKRIMCKKVLIKWLNAKPVLLEKYWWAVYILIGSLISPVVIYKSLNKHTNRELIYNFSPSPKSNFLFKFSFTKVGVWSKKSLIDNGVAVTYSNIRGKESVSACLLRPGEPFKVRDGSGCHRNSPFCGPSLLLILGLWTSVATWALTGELGWYQGGKATNVTRLNRGHVMVCA